MKPRRLVLACCLVFLPTLVITASGPAESRANLTQPPDCGGEPCDGVIRGLFAFFERRPHGLAGNGRACADCHMATDHFQLSPASVEARFRFLQWRRRWDPNADDPLFRPIDADDFRINGRTRATSAISARTASSGSSSRCRRKSGSSIPRPTRRRPKRSWMCGARCRRSMTWRSPVPTA